jgi:hypothetical protein
MDTKTVKDLRGILESKVTIKASGLSGIVRGFYIDEDKELSFYVNYADKNGAVFDRYFKERDIELS